MSASKQNEMSVKEAIKINVPAVKKIGPPVKVIVNPNRGAASDQNNARLAATAKKLLDQRRILNTININKLPDKGKRLLDGIQSLEADLEQLKITDKAEATKPNKVHSITNQTCKENQNRVDAIPRVVPVVIKKEHGPKIVPLVFKQQQGPKVVPVIKDEHQPQGVKIFPTFKQERVEPQLPRIAPVFKERRGPQLVDPSTLPPPPHIEARLPSFAKSLGSKAVTIRSLTNEAIEEFHKSLVNAPKDDDCDTPDPPALKVSLMKHQRQALRWMEWRESQKVSGGILADDMGLGKTLTMVAHVLSQNRKKTKVKKEKDEENNELLATNATLIVAPASLIHHWRLEIENRCDKGTLSVHMFHGQNRVSASQLVKYDIVITTYDIVRRNFPGAGKSTSKEDSLFRISWRRIILDEAHQIKNHSTQISKAACALNATSRWALSGTPVQNALNDLFSLIKFLHCSPFDDYRVWTSQVSKHSKATMRSKTLVAGLVLRREKSQKDANGVPIIKLPPKTFLTHNIKLSEFEQKVYEKLQKDGQALLVQEKVGVTAFLVMLLRLRQCCCHLNLLKDSFDASVLAEDMKQLDFEDCFKMMSINTDEKESDEVADKKLSITGGDNEDAFEREKTSGKVQFVIDELEKLRLEKPDDKSVIISEWTGFLEIMAHHLRSKKFSYSIIKGGITAAKRMDIVEQFNKNPTKPKIMLVSLQAGGVGLNLIGGNHLFLLNSHWNPSLEHQAFDRIYRVGQKKPVFIHKFITTGTIEEKMIALQNRKIDIANAVLGGAEEAKRQKLTLQDLKLLFNV